MIWLECPVEETDQRGRTRRTTEARDSRRGIPQGSPLSPLLANLYMRRFVLGWKKRGLVRSLGTRLVTYADDLVILCRRATPKRITNPRAAIQIDYCNPRSPRPDYRSGAATQSGSTELDCLPFNLRSAETRK